MLTKTESISNNSLYQEISPSLAIRDFLCATVGSARIRQLLYAALNLIEISATMFNGTSSGSTLAKEEIHDVRTSGRLQSGRLKVIAIHPKRTTRTLGRTGQNQALDATVCAAISQSVSSNRICRHKTLASAYSNG